MKTSLRLRRAINSFEKRSWYPNPLGHLQTSLQQLLALGAHTRDIHKSPDVGINAPAERIRHKQELKVRGKCRLGL